MSEPASTSTSTTTTTTTTTATATATAPSRAVKVTFYEDRAEVERVAQVTLPAGRASVRIGGLTALVDDTTVSASVEGGRVLSTRVRRVVSRQPAVGDAELAAAEADRQAAVQRATRTSRALARAARHEARCVAVLTRLAGALVPVPRGAEALAGVRSAHAEALTAEQVALDELAATRSANDDATLDVQRAEARLAAARVVRPRYQAEVDLELEAPAGAAEVRLRYRTPCALWRPEHLARLGDPSATGTGAGAGTSTGAGVALELITFATVWQRTGEDWTDVEAHFSTARPARSATPPLLSSDILSYRKKTDAERKTIVVESREQTVNVTGVAGSRAVDEMPGVDDGGEPVAFAAARPVSIQSTGQPQRLEVQRRALTASAGLTAWPERAELAHLRAVATLTGGALLAGPVRLQRSGALVGAGRVGFVGPGEPFELGFGVDDGVRIRRRDGTTREHATLSGALKLTRTVRLYLSNLSGQPRTLTVIERIPVSELEDVDIELLSRTRRADSKADDDDDHAYEPTTPPTSRDDDGFLRFELTLPPSSTRTLTLAWRLKAPSKVQINL
ncbi:MAG: DUF4139 domain-containing protein [Deltaproteobacteria bacterium]|nr:DUF4139 domain-containing protein [Deltaproteobacteria bacterium]